MHTQKILKNIFFRGNKSKQPTLIGKKLLCVVNFNDDDFPVQELKAFINEAVLVKGFHLTLLVADSQNIQASKYVNENLANILCALELNLVVPSFNEDHPTFLQLYLQNLNEFIARNLSLLNFMIPKSRSSFVAPHFDIQLLSNYAAVNNATLESLLTSGLMQSVDDIDNRELFLNNIIIKSCDQHVDFICAPKNLENIFAAIINRYKTYLNSNQSLLIVPEFLKLDFEYENKIFVEALNTALAPREIANKVESLPEDSQLKAFNLMLARIKDFETLKLVFKYLQSALKQSVLDHLSEQCIELLQTPENLRSFGGVIPLENRVAFFSKVSQLKPNLIKSLQDHLFTENKNTSFDYT